MELEVTLTGTWGDGMKSRIQILVYLVYSRLKYLPRQVSNVVESGSWHSSSKLTRGVIVNAGVLCSSDLRVWTVWRGVRNVLGSRLSSEELGSSSGSPVMGDSSNGDSGRRPEYPRLELGSRDKITVSSFDSV